MVVLKKRPSPALRGIRKGHDRTTVKIIKGKGRCSLKKQVIGGTGLESSELQGLLEGSYTGAAPEGWTKDKKLSKKTAKVYTDGKGNAVVAHRGTEGTMSDWSNNLIYGLAGNTGYRLTHRYKESKRVQDRAQKKYGRKNVSTIGHSQGGLLAQELGGRSKEIITLNKATRPSEVLWGSTKKGNQYDIRSSGDAVSAWKSPFQGAKGRKRDTSIKATSWNPVSEHGLDVLERDKGAVYGKLSKKQKKRGKKITSRFKKDMPFTRKHFTRK